MSEALLVIATEAARGVLSLWTYLARTDSRLFWGWLAAALALAALAYAVRAWRTGARASLGGLGRFLFPRDVWLHPSALLDYKFLVVDGVLFTVFLAPFLVAAASVADGLAAALAGALGARAAAAPGPAAVAACTVSVLLAGDFFRFLAHAAFHKVPALWEFHKVHHSAQVLTPATLFRVHPLERFTLHSAGGVGAGLAGGVFLWLYPQAHTAYTVLGLNAGAFLFNALGANLRHSHVRLSFGRPLERVLISPAQHQIHHSAAPAHRDRNMGSQFALWDWAFGTLVLAHAAPAPLTYGLGGPEMEAAHYDSVARLYLRPLGGLRRRRRASATEHAGSGF